MRGELQTGLTNAALCHASQRPVLLALLPGTEMTVSNLWMISLANSSSSGL